MAFTDPQVASFGLTGTAARTQGDDVAASVLTLDNVPRLGGPRYAWAQLTRRRCEDPQAARRAHFFT